ncbi:hypothetical protein ACWGQQ_35290 [Bradyrhizobium sp. Lot33]
MPTIGVFFLERLMIIIHLRANEGIPSIPRILQTSRYSITGYHRARGVARRLRVFAQRAGVGEPWIKIARYGALIHRRFYDLGERQPPK